jgi:hypothetical protein
MVDPDDVKGRFVVWRGPLPGDLVKNPTLLLDMAERPDATFVVVDSLKDVALRLSDDETCAAVNVAMQLLVREGIDVVSLHHPRKLGGDDSLTKTAPAGRTVRRDVAHLQRRVRAVPPPRGREDGGTLPVQNPEREHGARTVPA